MLEQYNPEVNYEEAMKAMRAQLKINKVQKDLVITNNAKVQQKVKRRAHVNRTKTQTKKPPLKSIVISENTANPDRPITRSRTVKNYVVDKIRGKRNQEVIESIMKIDEKYKVTYVHDYEGVEENPLFHKIRRVVSSTQADNTAETQILMQCAFSDELLAR